MNFKYKFNKLIKLTYIIIMEEYARLYGEKKN